LLVDLEPSLADKYRRFRVDFEENLFTGLRRAGEIVYPESLDLAGSATSGMGDVCLFMPGCTLSSYSQPLTIACLDLLLRRGVVDGMTSFCCGNPLGNAGLANRYHNHSRHFLTLLQANRVTRMVVACPNCLRSLESTLALTQATSSIALVPLPEILLELGIHYADNSGLRSIAVHDSCPDRFSQRFARATRRLFDSSGLAVLEMPSHGRDTICCGSGGLAQVYSHKHALDRRQRRLSEFAQTGADCLVCSCVSCVNMFLAKAPVTNVWHYLELLLDIRIDWQTVAANLDSALARPQDWVQRPLADSTPVFSPPPNDQQLAVNRSSHCG
jgi:Fe-S oxidoreductase